MCSCENGNCNFCLASQPPLNPDTFWMVFVEGANTPSKKHRTRQEAEAEAERLTISLHKKTWILFSAAYCQPATPPVKWTHVR